MRVATPTVSWHNRERVSSVDFQPVPYPCQTPNGTKSGYPTRLATAGDDKHVLIWEITIDESGKVEPNCLCDLNRHQNSVNVVRWSTNGRLLASGDTDSVIYVWQYEEKEAPPDIFAEEECIRRENWSILKCLRGHLQDVVGIAWSPDSNFIFSCSTDGTAIVFNVKKGDKVKILSDHNGWVNGVVWDPRNKHVATIASDRCLRLFGTKSYNYARKVRTCKLSLNGAQEKTTRLFHDDTFMSFYRRLDYSPDGELLAIPSGVIGGEGIPSDAKVPHCTHLFSRLNYTKPIISLPGKEFSVCVRFSPVRYTLRPVPRKTKPPAAAPEAANSSSKRQLEVWEKYETMLALPYRMVFAIASQNTVTFYDTQQCEPFAQVSRIHYVGLNDATWAPDGQTLMVGSTDGFCSVVNFKEGEIGTVYDENATASAPAQPPDSSATSKETHNKEGGVAAQIKAKAANRVQLTTLSSPAAGDNSKKAVVEEKKKRVALTPVDPPAAAAASKPAAADQPVKKRAQLFPAGPSAPAASTAPKVTSEPPKEGGDPAPAPTQKKRATLITLK